MNKILELKKYESTLDSILTELEDSKNIISLDVEGMTIEHPKNHFPDLSIEEVIEKTEDLLYDILYANEEYMAVIYTSQLLERVKDASEEGRSP